MENQKYLDFCGNIKKDFGLNLNPDDEIFPLIYKLITLNSENAEIISELKQTIEDNLKQISETNTNLYTNQATLLNKNNELLIRQEKALEKLYPKKSILFDNPETVKSYWKEKTKYVFILIFSILSLIVTGTVSFVTVSKTYKIQKFLNNAVIEQNYKGEKFLLLEKAESFDTAEIGNYVIWKEDNIAVPIGK